MRTLKRKYFDKMLSEKEILTAKIKDRSEKYHCSESSNNSPRLDYCQLMLKQPVIILKKLPNTICLNSSFLYNTNDNQISDQRKDIDFKQTNKCYSLTSLHGGLNLKNNKDADPSVGISNKNTYINNESMNQCNKKETKKIQNKKIIEFDTLRSILFSNSDLNLFPSSQNKKNIRQIDKAQHIDDETYKDILKKKISRIKTDKKTNESAKIYKKKKMDINISKEDVNDNSIFYTLEKKVQTYSSSILSSQSFSNKVILKLKNVQKIKTGMENDENEQTLIIDESKYDQNINTFRASESNQKDDCYSDIVLSDAQEELTEIVNISNNNCEMKGPTANYNNPLKRRIKCYETDESKCSNLFQIGSQVLQNIGNQSPSDSVINNQSSVNVQQAKILLQTIDKSDSLFFKKDNHLTKLITVLKKNLQIDVEDPDRFKLKIDIDEDKLTSQHTPKQKKIHPKTLLKNKLLMERKQKNLKWERRRKKKKQQQTTPGDQISKKQSGCVKKPAKLSQENIFNTQFSSNELNREQQQDNTTTKEMDNLIENSKTKIENKCPKHWMNFKLQKKRKKGRGGKSKDYLSIADDLKNKKWHKEGKETVQRNNAEKKRSCLMDKKHVKQTRRRKKKKGVNEDGVKANSESDNEKRITMEFPKHNWLQNKWEKNDCLGSVDPIEKTQNDCGFNMKFYCDQSRLHWRFCHDLKKSHIKRKDRKNNDDVKDNNDHFDVNSIPNSSGVSQQQNTYIKPDNLRKNFKLCSHCMTSCNQISSLNSLKENIPGTPDKTDEKLNRNFNSEEIDNSYDKINSHPVHLSPEKLGFCLLKKQNNTPVQMVFPQIKTPLVSEDIQDIDEARENTINLDNNTSQQVSEKNTQSQVNLNIQNESINDSPLSYGSETVSDESIISLHEGQYPEMNSSTITSYQTTCQKTTRTNNSDIEPIPNGLQTFAKQQHIETEADISMDIPKEPDHLTGSISVSSAPINQHSQLNRFPDYKNLERNINVSANNYSNSLLPKPFLASTYDSTSSISNLKNNESTVILDSHRVIPDQSIFQTSEFTSPLKMLNFQTNFYQNRPHDSLIKKPIPIKAQEISSHNSFVYPDHIRQTNNILESRQNSTNYTQRQQFIEAELERQKREFQQIEYIMSKKSKECEELLKLKCSKGELLKQIEYEQKLLLECQRQENIPAKDCMIVVRPVQHQGLETVYSTQEENNGVASCVIQVDHQKTPQQQFFSQVHEKHPKTHAIAHKHSNSSAWFQSGQCSLKRNSYALPPYPKYDDQGSTLLKSISNNVNNSLSKSIENIQNKHKGQNTSNFNHGDRNTTNGKIMPQNVKRSVHGPKITILPYINHRSLKNISTDSRDNNMKSNSHSIKENQTNSSISSPKLSQELTTGNINSALIIGNSNVKISEIVVHNRDALCIRNQEQIGLSQSIQESKLNKLPELPYQKSKHPCSRVFENKNNDEQDSIILQTNYKPISIPISFLKHSHSKQKDIRNYPLTAQLLQSQQFPLNTSMNKVVHNNSGLPASSRHRVYVLDNYHENNKNCTQMIPDPLNSARKEKLVRRRNKSPETIVIDDDDDDSNHATISEGFLKCKHCPKEASFLCSGCKNEWYCSQECQIAEWNQHSLVCKA